MNEAERSMVVDGIERITGKRPRWQWRSDDPHMPWTATTGDDPGDAYCNGSDLDTVLLHLLVVVAEDIKEQRERLSA